MTNFKGSRFFKRIWAPVLFAVIGFISGLVFTTTEDPYFLFYLLSMMALFGSVFIIGRKMIKRSKF